MKEIIAKTRTALGKKVKTLRRAGFLPAVLYGDKVASAPIYVTYKDFVKIYKEVGESALLKLKVEDKEYNVLIHDIMYEPVKGLPIHADFYAVQMDKLIRAKIPLEFLGESPAVKNEGGVLVKVIQELEVESLPQNLPGKLFAELTKLATLGSKLRTKNISVPTSVKILADPEDILVLVETPRSEAELTSLKEAPVLEAPVEVKTEQELKRAAKAESAEKAES